MIHFQAHHSLRLNDLDRRIVGALQVNGRASWRQIASAIDAPERTVAARGAELLKNRLVCVVGFTLLPSGGDITESIVSLDCRSGFSRVAAAAAATRTDSVFTLLTSGDTDCVFEVINDSTHTAALILEELPAIPGVEKSSSATVIRLYKGTHQWIPLVAEYPELATLHDANQSWEPASTTTLDPLDDDELAITEALSTDGRASVEMIARSTKISASVVRRKLAALHKQGRYYTRTVIEPALLGYPTNAVLRIRTMPSQINQVAEILKKIPEIRYLSFTTGRYQLFAEIACTSPESLNEFLFRADWTEHTLEVDTSLVIEPVKRGTIQADVSTPL